MRAVGPVLLALCAACGPSLHQARPGGEEAPGDAEQRAAQLSSALLSRPPRRRLRSLRLRSLRP
jgi:hypothetical protein